MNTLTHDVLMECETQVALPDHINIDKTNKIINEYYDSLNKVKSIETQLIITDKQYAGIFDKTLKDCINRLEKKKERLKNRP
jgi:hypothetical protein